jgi:hypothetical protein
MRERLHQTWAALDIRGCSENTQSNRSLTVAASMRRPLSVKRYFCSVGPGWLPLRLADQREAV